MKEYEAVIEALLDSGAHRAIKYLSAKRTLKATRKSYKGKFNKRVVEVQITDGPPNYDERKFIKLAKKAKEPFPIKKIQISFILRK